MDIFITLELCEKSSREILQIVRMLFLPRRKAVHKRTKNERERQYGSEKERNAGNVRNAEKEWKGENNKGWKERKAEKERKAKNKKGWKERKAEKQRKAEKEERQKMKEKQKKKERVKRKKGRKRKNV